MYIYIYICSAGLKVLKAAESRCIICEQVERRKKNTGRNKKKHCDWRERLTGSMLKEHNWLNIARTTARKLLLSSKNG